jgi:hypothetical protein
MNSPFGIPTELFEGSYDLESDFMAERLGSDLTALLGKPIESS